MMLRDLQQASGADFDKLYVDMQVTTHEEAVALFKSYAADGESEALRGFAEKTLPILEQHLETIEGTRPRCDLGASLHPLGAAEWPLHSHWT